MINYQLTPIYPNLYYFLLPPITSCTLQTVPNSTLLKCSEPENAEIIFKQSEREQNAQKIVLTKQDLLREGYTQTKRAWTEEEDAILLELCQDQNMRFEEVAQKIPGRNAKMCYSRYRRLTNQSKQIWTNSDDQKLRNLVQEFGTNNWKTLASHFPRRNYKQLKQHYQSYLRPDLRTQQWSVEEDLQLIELFNSYGKEWQTIQKKMFWRSRNQIKNRLFGRILRLHGKKKQSGTVWH